MIQWRVRDINREGEGGVNWTHGEEKRERERAINKK